MNDITQNAVNEALAGVSGVTGLHWTRDAKGNLFGWISHCRSGQLQDIAPALAELKARLLTITAYRSDKFARIDGREIAYHFDIDGTVLTVTVDLDGEQPCVPSIAPWFKNAGWNEREFAELYGIAIIDNPDPRRLFVDATLDADILDRMIPLSTLMNGASTTTLWEKVFAGRELPEWTKGGAI